VKGFYGIAIDGIDYKTSEKVMYINGKSKYKESFQEYIIKLAIMLSFFYTYFKLFKIIIDMDIFEALEMNTRDKYIIYLIIGYPLYSIISNLIIKKLRQSGWLKK